MIAWMLPGTCSPLLAVERPTSTTSTRGSACSCSLRLAYDLCHSLLEWNVTGKKGDHDENARA